ALLGASCAALSLDPFYESPAGRLVVDAALSAGQSPRTGVRGARLSRRRYRPMPAPAAGDGGWPLACRLAFGVWAKTPPEGGRMQILPIALTAAVAGLPLSSPAAPITTTDSVLVVAVLDGDTIRVARLGRV